MDVGAWDAKDLVLGLQGYIDSEDPVWPNDDRHYEVLTNFLIRTQPDPAGVRVLLGKHRGANEVDAHLLKRDKIARSVVHSLMGRIWKSDQEGAAGEDTAPLWEAIVYTGIHFSFEPVYEASHPGTGESLGEFFSDPNIPACDESKAAFDRHVEELIGRWRKRVTRKSSSLFFGNLLRHVGAPAADLLYAEWERMDANERYDLLRRTEGLEGAGKVSRRAAVDALLDESYDVRGAAIDVLQGWGAPIGELDGAASDERIEKLIPELREWADKTDS